jgi:divalent metal cation (Fe/Co/Zn/Cd) transporter
MAIASSGLTLDEIMDAAAPDTLQKEVREIASAVPDVVRIEKCFVRKSGLGLFVEIHVEVEGTLTVDHGHEIGHEVARLRASALRIQHVVVHVEPAL